MATNKHASIRYRALDRCFRDPYKKYFVKDLLEACNAALAEEAPGTRGIQKRQLYDDIRFMESDAGFSIELDKKKEGKETWYRYADLTFSIAQKGLNTEEAAQIREALMILSRFRGMPQFEWVDEISARLSSSFGLKEGAEKIIEFEQNKYLKGLEHITPLFNAILSQQVLSVQYKSFKQEKESKLGFHPYYLKQYNCRWFCFGWNEELKKISNLALDRIVSMKEKKGKYRKNSEISFEEYFEDVVGVTVEGEVQKVLLKVSRDLYPYIETKPLHASQTPKQREKDHVVLQYELRPNYELEALLLSHGEKIEILEPAMLKEKILKRAGAIR